MSGRLCPDCGKLKPPERFNKERRQCKDCRNKDLKAKRSGKPPKKPQKAVYALPSKAATKPKQAKQNHITLRGRTEADAFLRQELASMATQFNEDLEDLKAIRDNANNAKDFATAAKVSGSIRQTRKDKQAFLNTLTKQFKFLADLDRPAGEDPRFTPVTLVIESTPPASAMRQPIATLAPEDIQPNAS